MEHICKECQRVFSTKYNLRRHMEAKHAPSEEEEDEEEEVDEEMHDSSDVNDATSNDDDGEAATTSNSPSPWNYFIAETMDNMNLTNLQEMEEQFKKFLPMLQECTSIHVQAVFLLKRDKLYQQLKDDEARWVKRGFQCDEATATAWKLRKMKFKKILNQFIEREEARTS